MPLRNNSHHSALSRVPLGLNQPRAVLVNRHQHRAVLVNRHRAVLVNLHRAVLVNRHQAVLVNLHRAVLVNQQDSLDSNQIRLGCNHLLRLQRMPPNRQGPSTKAKNALAR